MARGMAATEATPRPRAEVVTAYLLLFVTVLFWGGSFVAARGLLAPADPAAARLTPLTLALARFGLAALLFLPPLALRAARRGRAGGPTPTVRLARGDWLRIALIGQLAISLFFWLQYTGVQLTNAGISSILTIGMGPLATAAIAAWWLREPFERSYALAFALGLAGIAIVATQRGPGLQFGLSRDFALGTLCLLANAVCFAAYSVLARGLRARLDALTLTAGITVAGAAGLAVLVAALDDWHLLLGLAPAQWLAIGYLALCCSVIGYFGYNHALATLAAGRAAAWVYLEPPIAVLLGVLLLGEALTPASVVGGALLGAAVWVVNRRR